MAAIKTGSMHPNQQSEVIASLTKNNVPFVQHETHIEIPIAGMGDAGLAWYSSYFVCSEIEKPNVNYLPSSDLMRREESVGEISFFCRDEQTPEGFHVEFEISEEVLQDVLEYCGMLEVSRGGQKYVYGEGSADEFGNREEYREECTIADIFEGAFSAADKMAMVVCYLARYGADEVEKCRAAYLEERARIDFKPALEAVLNPVAVAA